MKSEIRGLKAGLYQSKDESLVFRVKKRDNGVIIEIGDLDADIFYEVTIDEKSNASFKWGNITPSLDNNKGDSNGES